MNEECIHTYDNFWRQIGFPSSSRVRVSAGNNNREDGGWQHLGGGRRRQLRASRNEGGQEGAARTAAGARARAAEKAAAMASPTSPTTADGGGDGGTDAGVEAPTEAGVAEEEVWRARSRGPRCPTGSPTRWRTRCGGRGGRERGGRGGGGSYAIARRARAGPVVRVALLAAAAKKQYLGEQAASGKTVALVRGARELYPSMLWSIQLGIYQTRFIHGRVYTVC